MAVIESLAMYPMAGARVIPVEISELSPAGLVYDREYVAYDPDTMKRVSAKPGAAPKLMQIQPRVSSLTSKLDVYDADTGMVVDVFDLSPYSGSSVFRQTIEIDEFGQQTPWLDMGEEPADFLSDFLHKNVRMAHRDTFWQEGGLIDPHLRTVAPLHIISRASCNAVAEMLGADGDLAPRFRPNIVIDGVEAFEEMHWQSLSVRGLAIAVHRPTARCAMTGLDPLTGKNLRDIPNIFSQLPQMTTQDGKLARAFGVYAYPELGLGERSFLSAGDEIEIKYLKTSR